MATIRKRPLPSGKVVWQCDYRDQAGKRRSKQFPTRKAADAWLVGARGEVVAGTHVADSETVTIKVAAAQWIAECERREKAGLQMERASLAAYRSYVNIHVLDPTAGIGDVPVGIGGMKLNRLTRKDVNAFRDRLIDNGRSIAMVRKALKALRLLLGFAQDNLRIGTNPAKGVVVHSTGRVKAKVVIPDRPVVRKMIEASPDHYRTLLMVAALCGLRASEIRGLRWTDVDLVGGYINVSQRADRYGTIGQTKSEAGTRAVPIGPAISTELKKWKLRCPRSELDFVFPSKTGTVQYLENIQSNFYKPLLKKVGVKARFHDLRHFACSLWIDQGFPPKAIMTFAGHSSITLTMDLYGHLFPSPEHHAGMAEV